MKKKWNRFFSVSGPFTVESLYLKKKRVAILKANNNKYRIGYRKIYVYLFLGRN